MKTFGVLYLSSDGRQTNAPDLGTDAIQCHLPVEEWWTQTITTLGEPLTRENLVLFAANKDGGAHVNAVLDPKYKRAMEPVLRNGRRGQPMEITEQPVSDTHLVYLRQIAQELSHSLELLKLMEPSPRLIG